MYNIYIHMAYHQYKDTQSHLRDHNLQSRKKESLIPNLLFNLLFNPTFPLLPCLVHGICLLTPVILSRLNFIWTLWCSEATAALTLIPNDCNFCYSFWSSRSGSERQHIRSAGIRTVGAPVLSSHVYTGSKSWSQGRPNTKQTPVTPF